MSLNKSKSAISKPSTNGTLTANLNKNVNGTTIGNVAFVLNNPSSAYIWNNPLTRVLTRNNPNKSVQWQFNKGGLSVNTPSAGVASPAPARAAAPAPAGQTAANPQPQRQVAPLLSQQLQQQVDTSYNQQQQLAGGRPSYLAANAPTMSYVVPAARGR